MTLTFRHREDPGVAASSEYSMRRPNSEWPPFTGFSAKGRRLGLKARWMRITADGFEFAFVRRDFDGIVWIDETNSFLFRYSAGRSTNSLGGWTMVGEFVPRDERGRQR
jgi:hypothetical protein